MRFLADENIPGNSVAEIEGAGHDIVWVRIVAETVTTVCAIHSSMIPNTRNRFPEAS